MVADQEHENFDEVLEKGDLLEGEIHNCATVSALLHRRSINMPRTWLSFLQIFKWPE